MGKEGLFSPAPPFSLANPLLPPHPLLSSHLLSPPGCLIPAIYPFSVPEGEADNREHGKRRKGNEITETAEKKGGETTPPTLFCLFSKGFSFPSGCFSSRREDSKQSSPPPPPAVKSPPSLLPSFLRRVTSKPFCEVGCCPWCPFRSLSRRRRMLLPPLRVPNPIVKTRRRKKKRIGDRPIHPWLRKPFFFPGELLKKPFSTSVPSIFTLRGRAES